MHTVLRDRLIFARKGRGYTQPELAEATGLSREVISLIERDANHDPRHSTLREIARVLGDPHLFCEHCAEAVS